MNLQELINKIFYGDFSHTSLSKLLSENVYTIDEITEYMNDVNTTKIFAYEFKKFEKLVHLKRRVMKKEPEPKAEFKITKIKEN